MKQRPADVRIHETHFTAVKGARCQNYSNGYQISSARYEWKKEKRKKKVEKVTRGNKQTGKAGKVIDFHED